MRPPHQLPIGARPRQARSRETRERFYEATLDRFAAEGVEEARVQDIVDDAGGSWGAYHHYFPRKEDVLLERAAREVRDRLRPLADAAIADRRVSIHKTLEKLFVSMMHSELPKAVHGAVLREINANPLRFAAMLDEGQVPIVGIVGMLLAEGQERGEVRDDADPYSLGAVLAGGTVFPVMQTAFGPVMPGLEGVVQPPDPAAAVRRTFEITWRAVAA
ncbi:MAG TPA: TetR/AcrR family transcriptional regulator [Solirubrobacterales bacterium]